MSQLVNLQAKLQQVGATMAQLEMQLARHPESRGLAANFRSMSKLHENLQGDFNYAANELGLDVMHYRLLEARPSARALSSSVGTFQDAIAVAYDALRSGPKKIRRQMSPVIVAESTLRVAYSYPGSFGVVFTIPNERLLIPDLQSNLDKAMQTVIDLGKAGDSQTIIGNVEHSFGKATISAVYDWAKANSQNRVGTAIEWWRDDQIRAEALIQEPEFTALSDSLENFVDKSEDTVVYTGTLVGADIKTHRFHFVTSDDEDIRGKFSTAISDSQVAEVPHRYSAAVLRTIERRYAPEEERVSFFLEKLGPL